jgi:alkylhydroperoxidase family enzyme
MAAKVDCYESSDLSERHKVALRLTEALITWPKGITPELREQAFAHFTPEEIAEILFDVTKWSTQKIPVALGMDVQINPKGLATFDFDAEGKVVWGGPIEE